jgi:tetratricopeptide (TPR) repeat protein
MTDPLHRFATRVVELQARKDAQAPALDEATMLAVAKDLGMSEEDLVRLREEARTAKQKAKTLRMAGALDEAVDVLETAHAFHPLDLEVSYALADALYAQSQKAGEAPVRQTEWERARAIALSIVDAAPAHAEAATLLNAIKNNEPTKKDTSIPWGVIFGIAAALAAVAGLLAWIF